jgi:phage gp29-like protein
MAKLLDQYGRPVELTRLRQVQAEPTLSGVRSILSGHPAQGLTPARLTRLLHMAEQGDATAYLELAEEMEEKDLHYLSVLGTRKRAVAQLEINVESASDDPRDVENADLIRDWLGREELEDEMFDILDAIGKGFSVTEIIWDMSERQWWPSRLKRRDQRWFEFDRDNGETLYLKGLSGTEDLWPFKYVTHFAAAKSGLPIRGGLARAAAWAYLFKNYDLKDWITYIEVHGQPLRVGKYHTGATEADKEVLLRAVANIGSDAAAIIPSNMMIEFVEAAKSGGGTGTDIYEKLANWLDKQISKAVLGQTLTTEVSGGSLAAARVHDDVRRDIMRADARQLASALNRDIVRPLIDLNRGPQKRYPRISIGLPVSIDSKQFAEALGALIDRGLKVEQSVVRDRMGLPDPDETGDLLRPMGAPDAAPPPPPPAAPPPPALQAQGRAPGCSCHAAEPDALDALADDLAGEWQEAVDPMLDPVKRLLGEAGSLEEFRDRLAALIGEMDTAAFEELLVRGTFSARLAGRLEADLGRD